AIHNSFVICSVYLTGVGSLICLLSVWFIIPRFGIYGYIFGSLFGMLITSALNLYRVNKNSALSLNLSDFILKPLLSSALASLSVSRLKAYISPLFSSALSALILCLALCLIFAFSLILTGAVKKRDIAAVISPFLKK
ncbi:MAG: polysaccharide biosynthesis C-terminal domain-containing protein, partial [Clostridiales bacterium]|nr:polysaccharide biosynthesis C-terminal domain-containing protein [Clostridiales bacterium]